MAHTLFVDEVGNGGLGVMAGPNERYLCLAGVIFERGYLSSVVEPAFDALKAEFFSNHSPTSPLVFHRKELMNARKPFEDLKADGARDRFDDRLLSLLTSLEFTLILVIIDKYAHDMRYDKPHHPYHYCMQAMLERFVGELRYRGSTGNVVAEGRGKKEDRALCEAFAENVRMGSQWSSESIRRRLTSDALGIATKGDNVAGLQVADLIAHPCFRRAHAIHLQLPIPGGFSGQLALAMKPKLRKDPRGNPKGWGIKWLP